ncbi:hypothetical protein A2870_02270 [Candidatus Curtissbacteria bacterium RIFCSPHIGHO2_01_FULL_41_11]|uniref:Uncharacterized protein n=1 Tax=Candidatus Curtissbacteria bacterium RIFCSPHIGHO2_01_FULL_41_11 TaxID=1797711 RepID=A0A1F5G5H5_9BACT|nr:MAG: hypothetical protein A2870_02270 [Candidatus Curtissbacteria bacterium RIFCSPHIGHO2_01_FULL_41_11]
MSQELEPVPKHAIKLCNHDDEVWIIGHQTSWRSMGVKAREIENIGRVSIHGANFVVNSYDHVLLLNHQGLSLKATEEIEDDHDLYCLSIKRQPLEIDDDKPLPQVIATIDGCQISLTSRMYGGNPDLPEEAFDWIETWRTNVTESEVEIPLVTPADAQILSLLNFHFQS